MSLEFWLASRKLVLELAITNLWVRAQMLIEQSRRRLLSQIGVAGIAGLSGIAGVGFGGARSFAAEPPPEITTIKLKEYSPG